LSGDIGTTSVSTDNCYRVVVANGVALFPQETRLDGCTITDGYGNGTSSTYRTGAGVFVTGSNSDVRVFRCVVISNSSPVGGGDGGGVGSLSSGSQALFQDCFILNNSCYVAGGGAYVSGATNFQFTNCTFSGNSTTNSSDIGGGGLFSTSSAGTHKTTLIGCTFSGNSTNQAPGGAIYHSGSGNTLVINGSEFNSNTANSGNGGAIDVASGAMTIKNSTFTGNKAKLPTTIGGGGAIVLDRSAGVQAS
jgi:hypothetical protein